MTAEQKKRIEKIMNDAPHLERLWNLDFGDVLNAGMYLGAKQTLEILGYGVREENGSYTIYIPDYTE